MAPRLPYNVVVISAWSDPKGTERNVAWTRDLLAAPRPVEAAYGTKLARLAALKAKYDPKNLFRMNQNIAQARL